MPEDDTIAIDMKVIIRNWKTSDLDHLVKYANNANVSQFLTDGFPFPYTREFGENFIKEVMAQNPTKVFAISHEDQAIGSIGIYPDEDVYKKNAAIAYWVAEQYWGRGVAVQAIRQIVEYGFETLNLDRIYAKPFGDNLNSRRVLEKVGFTLEATFPKVVCKYGEYLDEYVYGLRK